MSDCSHAAAMMTNIQDQFIQLHGFYPLIQPLWFISFCVGIFFAAAPLLKLLSLMSCMCEAEEETKLPFEIQSRHLNKWRRYVRKVFLLCTMYE